MATGKNRIPFGIGGLSSGNKQMVYRNLMAKTDEELDQMFVNSRIVFKCICLSSLMDGVTAPSSPSTITNSSVKLVTLGDGIKRYKIKFRVAEMLDPIGASITFSNGWPDPFENGIDNLKMNRRISLHPSAYTEVEGKYAKAFVFGMKVTIKRLPGMWVVTSFSTPFTNFSYGSSGKGTKDEFDAGTGQPPTPEPEKDPNAELTTLISDLSPGSSVLIFGDSQAQTTSKGKKVMGLALQQYLMTKKLLLTNREAKEGKDPSFYVDESTGGGWNLIKGHLESTFKPKLIIIFLGGNGISKASELLVKCQALLPRPDTKYIWVGAPPPSANGDRWNMSDVLSSGKTRYKDRKDRNTSLKSVVSPKVDLFINPYDLYGFTTGYSCKDDCDGLHVNGEDALIMLHNAGLYDE